MPILVDKNTRVICRGIRRTAASRVLMVSVLAFGIAKPAYAQSAIAERSYQYFVEFCVAPFPDVEKTRAAIEAAKWQRVSSGKITSDWLLQDPANQTAYYVLIRSFEGKAHCMLAFDQRATFPIQQLADRNGFKQDRALGDRLTSASPDSRYGIFIKIDKGTTVSLVLRQTKDSKSSHEISISTFPVI